MERGIITISEGGVVSMPTAPVWMTQFEIADLFGVFSCNVRKAIHSIYKNKELNEADTMKYVRQADGISYDVYSLEMVIAIAFRICSKNSMLFRQFVIGKLNAGKVSLFVSCSRGTNQWYNRLHPVNHSFPMLGCKGSVWFDGRSKVRRQSRFGLNLPPAERIQPENLAPADHTLVRHPATETSD